MRRDTNAARSISASRTNLAGVVLRNRRARLRLLLRLLVTWITGDLFVVELHGRSMEPSLSDGDHLFCSRRAHLFPTAIVVRELRSSRGRPFHQVKRLTGLAGDERCGALVQPGYCWIEGDNKEISGDSRQFGAVPRDELVGVAIARLSSTRLDDLTVPLSRHPSGIAASAKELWLDWRGRVSTRGSTKAATFGFSPMVVYPSVPTPWKVLRGAFAAVGVEDTDVLLDYGCGKGRVPRGAGGELAVPPL